MYTIVDKDVLSCTLNGTSKFCVKIVADTAADIPEPSDTWAAGSEVEVLENGGSKYKLTNSREWVKVNFKTGAGGGDNSELAEQIETLKNNALMKNQGAENVGKILVVGTDGNLILTNMPEGSASGDVTGVLDESNNILLSGNLADGTYTLKYENEDGTYTEIGTLNVGEIEKPKTNFAGTVTVGRLSNSAATNVATDAPSARVTDFISVMTGDVLSVQGFNIKSSSPEFSFMTFDSSKAKLGVLTDVSGASTDYALTQETTNTGSIVEIISDSVAYIRFSGKPSGAEEDIVVNIQRNGEWL